MVPVGFGKTVVALTAIAELLEEGTFKRILIVAPLRVCQTTWRKEHRLWEHLKDLDVGICIGTEKARNVVLNSDHDITVVNFENLKWLLDSYSHRFDALLIDELTKLKGGGAAFKSLRRKHKQFKWVCGMTGTLVEEGLDTLFYQFMAVDGGKTFGRNKQTFLERYFVSDWNGYNWTPLGGTMGMFTKMIARITYSVETYEDLRDPVIDVISLNMPDAARKEYNTMKKDMITELGGETVTAANSAVLSGKLQQVCAGFLYTEHGAHPVHIVKMLAVIDEVVRWRSDPDNGPVLIVYTFKWELDQLKEAFKRAFVFADNPEDNEERWNAGEIEVMLIHPMSAGHGLNLQHGGHRIIFMGPVWSRDQTDQVIGRLNRRGQTKVVYASFFAMVNTVEDKVMIPRVLGKADTAREFKRHLLES